MNKKEDSNLNTFFQILPYFFNYLFKINHINLSLNIHNQLRNALHLPPDFLV